MNDLIVATLDVQKELLVLVDGNLAENHRKTRYAGGRRSDMRMQGSVGNWVFERENQREVRCDFRGERIVAITYGQDFGPLWDVGHLWECDDNPLGYSCLRHDN